MKQFIALGLFSHGQWCDGLEESDWPTWLCIVNNSHIWMKKTWERHKGSHLVQTCLTPNCYTVLFAACWLDKESVQHNVCETMNSLCLAQLIYAHLWLTGDNKKQKCKCHDWWPCEYKSIKASFSQYFHTIFQAICCMWINDMMSERKARKLFCHSQFCERLSPAVKARAPTSSTTK